MSSTRKWRDVKKLRTSPLIALVVAGVVVAIGAGLVGHGTVEYLFQTHAVRHAETTARFAVSMDMQSHRQANDESALQQPFRPSVSRLPGGRAQLQWRYDASGMPVFNEHQAENQTLGAAFPVRSSTIARQVLKSKQVHFTKVAADQLTLTRVFVPMMRDDQLIGILEVVTDDTAFWSSLIREFYNVAIKVLGMALLAFSLPGFLYLRQVRNLKSTARHMKEKEQYDRLTGALNRTAFTDFMRDSLYTMKGQGREARIVVIDIDHFKKVNEQKGQVFGDELLSQVAKRLRFLLAPHEKLARLGGDEFAIFLPGVSGRTKRLQAFLGRIIPALSKPFVIMGQEINIDVSVGSALYPLDGEKVEEIVHAANMALLVAKESAGSAVMEYRPGMNSLREQRQAIEQRLREALRDDEFWLNYQPFYSADGKTLAGFEALLRVSAQDGTPISPAVFIPVAEETGLIAEIGTWVLRKAAGEATRWPENLRVSVNLSPVQFQTRNVPALVRKVLAETGLAPHRLELEITEGVFIKDSHNVLSILQEVKQIGTSLALDDFGTGYSSLNYLWQYPFDKLKVDKSFINDLANADGKSREILTAIIALGRVLGLQITAEGVETEQQAAVLRALNCDLIQGYLYGRPLNAQDVDALLELHAESDLTFRIKEDRQNVMELTKRAG